MSEDIPKPQVYIGFSWKRVFTGVVLILGLLSFLGLVSLYFLDRESNNPYSNAYKVSSRSATKSSSKPTLEAAGWKTVEGKYVPIRLKIPPGYKITEDKGTDAGADGIVNKGLSVEGFANKNSLNFIYNFFGGFGSPTWEAVEDKDILIDGRNLTASVMHDAETNPDDYLLIIWVSQKDNPFVITFSYKKGETTDREMVDKILGTVEFL